MAQQMAVLEGSLLIENFSGIGHVLGAYDPLDRDKRGRG
jgi:hypothetical protein